MIAVLVNFIVFSTINFNNSRVVVVVELDKIKISRCNKFYSWMVKLHLF